MANLTLRQEEILKFIISEIKLKGYPPSVREIGANVGLSSTSTVHAHLTHLEEKGIIRKDPTKPRALEIIHPEYAIRRVPGMVDLPIVSKIIKGKPISEYIEGYFKLTTDAVSPDTLFMLRVNQEDLNPFSILKGDLVIVGEQSSINTGELVIAVNEAGEGVVKAFKSGDEVLGKVIGMIRLSL